jgi:hypothetical protein
MALRSPAAHHRGAGRGLAARRDGGALGRRLRGLLLLLLVVGTGCVTAAEPTPPDGRPGVFLAGANVPRAKALALDAALVKGWRVAESNPDHVIFETLLDTPASAGPPGIASGELAPPDQTLLRIRADFSTIDNGVMTALRADEVWYAGTARAWTADVTAQYRGNLMNALSSLRAQWASLAPAAARAPAAGPTPRPRRVLPQTPLAVEPPAAAAAPSPTAPRSLPAPSQTAVPRLTPVPATPPAASAALASADDPVGVWAYHAEQFAAAHGCTLADRGAVLVREADGVEMHQVYCQGGSSVLVRCDRASCLDGR